MLRSYTRMFVLAAAVAVGAPPLMAEAQQAQQQPQPQAQAPAAQQETVKSADVTDTELEQFAKSIEEVVEIQQETEKQLESVTDTAEVQRMKTEANEKMAAAIQGNGMEVQRYNLIARSINQDPELKERLQQKMQELRQPA